MSAVEQIDIELTVVVGSTELPLSAALALERGAVVPLGRDAEKPVSILANGRKIADGRVRLLSDKVAVEVATRAAAARADEDF